VDTTILLLIVLAIVVIIVIIVGNRYGASKIITRFFHIEFFSNEKGDFAFRPCYTIDPVISMDGKIYKIHLMVSGISQKKLNITNWHLKINGIGDFSFKQYYLDELGNRKPLGKTKLIVNKDTVFYAGIEFEPEEAYSPIQFSEGLQKCTLTCENLEGKTKFKFQFRVRALNLIAIKLVAKSAKASNKPQVISFPIIVK